MAVRQGDSSISTRSCLADLHSSTEGILTKVERARRTRKVLFPNLNEDIHEGNELEMNKLNFIWYLRSKIYFKV